MDLKVDNSWCGDGETFNLDAEGAPPLHQGHLWKKSPNPLRIRKYQQRYVELALGFLSWSAGKGSLNKGRVDFSKNQCEVSELRGSDTEFEVRPLGGSWVEGDFTGIESGRALVFDASDSEHSRAKWIEIIYLHMTYGQKYGSPTGGDPLGSFATIGGAADALGTSKQTPMKNGESDSDEGGNSSMVPGGAAYFRLETIEYEEPGGIYPLKHGWDIRVPKPPVPDRNTWRGVFTGAPTDVVEELAGSARFQHPAIPLDQHPGEPDPSSAPAGPEDGALRHVMEFINYHIVLQGRPRCWYGGIGPSPLEMRNMQRTKSGLFPGHFECQACFACPQNGNGGASDLIKNCWSTQAMLNHGGFQWMSLTAGHNGEEFMPFTTPFGLQGVPMPPRSQRAELLEDPEYTKDHTDLTALASSLYASGHGPYVVVYRRPPEHDKEQETDPRFSWNLAQDQVNQVAKGNDSRVLVYPPPGMIVKGGFSGERIGGRKNMPGEAGMAEQAGVPAGSTLGGPCIKVHLFAISDHGKYKGCDNAKLVDLETGKEVPCWVCDSMAAPGSKYHNEPLNEMMDLSAGKVWMIPKPILAMNREYQCSMCISMEDGPIDLLWSWTTFGPRVYDVACPDPEDTTKSLDWALETVSDMKMKPKMRPDGLPVPSVICIRPGVYTIRARLIDPGAWLHIEGAGAEETTLVVETPSDCETFEFPKELGTNGFRGQKTGYEYGWQNPDMPLFNLAQNCFRNAEHDGGGADMGGFKQPRRTVSISGVTLRHNIPLVFGCYGHLELVDCHVIGPTLPSGSLALSHVSGAPLLRLSEVTHQHNGLFAQADADGDGRVSFAEWRHITARGAGLGSDEAQGLFTEADADEDGYLSPREFETAYYRLVMGCIAGDKAAKEEREEYEDD